MQLKLQPLLSAQWHYRLFERCWQIFFGGVFDKRARMLFAARRNEDGNVHRRDGVSKTVTKNMWAGFFYKNPKTKERPKEAPERGKNITAETCLIGRQAGERSFPDLILKGISGFLSVFFPRFAPLTLKQVFRTARMTNISGLQPYDLKNHSFRLKENPFPRVDETPLTLQHADAFIMLTASAIALTTPSIPMPDEGVKTPFDADVRIAYFDAQLLAGSARLLATFDRMVDVEVFSIKNFNLLKTNVFCLKRVDKNDDDRKIIFSD